MTAYCAREGVRATLYASGACHFALHTTLALDFDDCVHYNNMSFSYACMESEMAPAARVPGRFARCEGAGNLGDSAGCEAFPHTVCMGALDGNRYCVCDRVGGFVHDGSSPGVCIPAASRRLLTAANATLDTSLAAHGSTGVSPHNRRLISLADAGTALLTIYSALGGSAWTTKAGWVDFNPSVSRTWPCNAGWHGILCNDNDDAVK